MQYNYHTHTARCNHAQGEEREYIERAIENGLKVLGFSDHAPYAFPNTDYRSHYRMADGELFDYAETIRALAKEYERDIRILCGFELEYYPKYHAEEMAFLAQVRPDYLIMGQHFIDNEIDGKYIYAQSDDRDLTAYVTQVLEGLSTGDFLYLAHPDIPGFRFSKAAIDREYRRLCEGAKALSIPLEINLLGIRSKRHYPDERFFAIAADVGNEIVLGCDSHSPASVGEPSSEKIAREMVKKLGLNLIEQPFL